MVKELPDLCHMPTESVAAVDGSSVSERLASFDLDSPAGNPKPPPYTRSSLSKYIKLVRPASTGAVTA